MKIYNHCISLLVLNYKPPLEAMKEWQVKEAGRFKHAYTNRRDLTTRRTLFRGG